MIKKNVDVPLLKAYDFFVFRVSYVIYLKQIKVLLGSGLEIDTSTKEKG